MGNDILDCILRLVHTNLLISLIKYITQVTEKCIHNAGVGGSSPPVATIFNLKINSLKSTQTVLRFSLLPIAGDLRELSLLIKVRVGAELPDQP